MTAKSHHRGIFETIKIPLLWNNRDCEIPTMGKNWENKITALGIIWYKEIPVLGITGVMKIPLLGIFWVSPSPWMGIVEFSQTGILLEKSNKTPWISHIFPFLFPTGSFLWLRVLLYESLCSLVHPCYLKQKPLHSLQGNSYHQQWLLHLLWHHSLRQRQQPTAKRSR